MLLVSCFRWSFEIKKGTQHLLCVLGSLTGCCCEGCTSQIVFSLMHSITIAQYFFTSVILFLLFKQWFMPGIKPVWWSKSCLFIYFFYPFKYIKKRDVCLFDSELHCLLFCHWVIWKEQLWSPWVVYSFTISPFLCHLLVRMFFCFFLIAAGCRQVTLAVIKWYKFTLHQTLKGKRSSKNKNMSLVRLLL